MISVIILTKNKNEILSQTLKSISWCDQKIILENSRLMDFAAQRNLGLEKAKGDWILYVDDDEIVTPELMAEISEKTKDSKYNGYFLRRTDVFQGQELHFGETGNIKLLRLARKGVGQWRRKVHEVWKTNGKVGELKNPLIHFPHPTISKFIFSINHHTDIDAQELNREGKKFNYLRIVLNPLGKFLVNYFLKLGFLDGRVGFVHAFMMSLYSLTVRVKQYDLS